MAQINPFFSEHLLLLLPANPLSSTRLQLTGYVLFLGPSSVNPRDDCEVMKIPADQHLETLRPTGRLAPTSTEV